MRIVLVALLIVFSLDVVAPTALAEDAALVQPTCACTVSIPATKRDGSACTCAVTLPAPVPDTRGTERTPLTVKVTKLPDKTPAEVARDYEERAEKASTDRWTTGLALATTLILAFQLVVFERQARRLNESVQEAKRATEATNTVAVATQTAASIAEQTVNRMNLTALRDLRAYVAVPRGSIEKLDENGSPRATVVIKNFGRTPAYLFAPSAQLDYVPPNEKPRIPQEPTRELGHLAPGAEFEVVLDAPWQLSGPMRHHVLTKTGAVYAQGTIKYADTYGIQRFTRFRVRTDGAASVPSGRLVSCDSWNETDDDETIAAAIHRETAPSA